MKVFSYNESYFDKKFPPGKAALVVIEMVVFGPLLLIAYCGVFGGRGIVDVLKILRDLFRTSSFSFLEL